MEINDLLVYVIPLLVFMAAFGLSSAGLVVAFLPGFLATYFLLECRKTVRLLLSLPITMILVLVPTWVLNIFGAPVSGSLLIALSLLYSAAFAFLLRKTGLSLKTKIKGEHVAMLILVAAAVFMTYPLHNGLLPRTDGSAHYYKIWEVRNSIDSAGTIPFWDAGWYAGYPIFDFYPPMSYYLTVFVSYLVPSSLGLVFNYVMILSYLYIAVGTFSLARKLGLNIFSSFLAGLIITSSPRLSSNTMFSGQFPTIVAFSMVPLAVYVFMKAFEGKKPAVFVLSGALIGLITITHNLTGYFLALIFMLVFSVFALRSRRPDFSGFAMTIIAAGLLGSFWLMPFFSNLQFSEYYSNAGSSAGFSPDVMLVLATSPDKSCADFYCFISMGVEITLLAIIGILVWTFGFSAGRGRLFVSPKLRVGSAITISMLVVVLVFAMSPFLGISKFVPFGSLGAERFIFYMILPLAILGGSIGEIVNGFDKKDFLVAGLVVSLIVAAPIYKYLELTNFRAGEWNNETAPLDVSGLSEAYKILRALPPARVMTYGIFQAAIVSGIPVQANKTAISGWHVPGSPNYQDVAGRVEDVSGQGLFKFNLSDKYVYSIYQNSWTGWVLINLCGQEGQMAVNNTFAKDDRYLFVWRSDNGNGCLVILEVPNVTFAERVEPVGVVDNDKKIVEKIYDTETGYLVHFTKRLADLPEQEYKVIINKDVLWNPEQADQISRLSASEPAPLEWSRNGNLINVKNAVGWILIKETYYPVWTAWNGDKKLEIRQTDMGFMLVKSEGDLQLRPERTGLYLLSAAITLLFSAYFAFSAFSKRPSAENVQKEPETVF